METDIKVTRRKFFGRAAAFSAGVLGLGASKRALAEVCELTPAQGEGPFYPEKDLDRDSDLTQLKPGMSFAKGQVIYVKGRVTDDSCAPIEGVLVEVWQACHSGKYNHSEDKHNLELDPNFQYWGRARTNAKGDYLFKTIIPGHYPNGGGTYRPPHIHFKVHAAGFVSLTTQMYFNPDSYDDESLKKIVTKWNDYEGVEDGLKVLFKPITGGAKSGQFDISLRRH